VPREKERDLDKNLYEKIDHYGLVPNLEACLTCGKCVGNCPVAVINPSFNSRQMIRDVLVGNATRLLQSEEIWQCFWCGYCYQSCPMGIHFPLLMMQIRYLAIENNYGLRYFAPFKKFALRARDDGMTFVAGSTRGRERIMAIRSEAGMTPWPEISEKAREEYKALFDLTGTTAWLEAIDPEAEIPASYTYREGRIVHD
jgi:heterodisulfide reductase subunit C